ncbi:kinase-like domain-containing protein [Rhizophagus irregularis DAOM 181602=DAOM 197198]|nr:kinase-like domain-containing protein [Rhizophagus irregularis DAOM 181602=DAOM 197198]
MDEIKLSDDVFEQLKEFCHYDLTEEQKSLIDKLITDKELNKRYKKNRLCKNCKQINTRYNWCQPCVSKRFQQNLKNWTSGNHDVDEFIQKAQLKTKDKEHIVEWIEYDKFEDVEYLAKGGFGTTFKAVWKDGPIRNCDDNQWNRDGKTKVALKCLHNSQGITAEFLKEVESNILVYNSIFDHIVRCFDPLKRPNSHELKKLFGGLWQDIYGNKMDSVIYGQVKEADDINKKLSFSSPLTSTEPKNADNNNDLLGIEYSDSLKMDFTKLDINSKDESN